MAKGGEARVRRADQPAKFDGERVDAYVEFLVRTNFRDQQQWHLQNFSDFLLHQILQHMHKVLNIDKNNNYLGLFVITRRIF